jgi:3-deoxy-manno-octulosonate cytidylyltransferase (CMP-KDO synthetase)
MKALGIIPARWNSSRFPGKPLALIDGKTLLQCTYENALRSEHLSDLIIATDDERIADHAKSFGAKAIMTSASHRNGTERLAEVVASDCRYAEMPYVINVQGDEPLLPCLPLRQSYMPSTQITVPLWQLLSRLFDLMMSC